MQTKSPSRAARRYSPKTLSKKELIFPNHWPFLGNSLGLDPITFSRDKNSGATATGTFEFALGANPMETMQSDTPIRDLLSEADRRVTSLEQELARTTALLRENQKLATMGRLTASIAHEINNPIASIMNLLYLMRDENLSDDGRNFLDLAGKELERVVQITRQTLTFQRETAAPVSVRPQDLLDDVIGLFRQKARNAGVTISREYETEDSITVFPGEMRQVFANLVSNAIDATASGGRIRLRVRTVSSWSEPGVRGVRVTVADTGSGIPEDVLHRIGDAFYTTKGQSGTGLGLWVSSGIILKYGGFLQISSSTNPVRHGTVFNIFLPANLRPSLISPLDTASDAGSSAEKAIREGPGAQTNLHQMPRRDVAQDRRHTSEHLLSFDARKFTHEQASGED
jgi:signal transduction histidine kinase